MKKLLALVLALAMVLSAATVLVSAEEEDEIVNREIKIYEADKAPTLDGKIEEGKAETASLLADGRTDDANFAKVRTNIYDICRTVSQTLIYRPGAGTGAVRAQLERFRAEWSAALEKAKQHDNINGIAVEETKLTALEDVIAHFREVKE